MQHLWGEKRYDTSFDQWLPAIWGKTVDKDDELRCPLILIILFQSPIT